MVLRSSSWFYRKLYLKIMVKIIKNLFFFCQNKVRFQQTDSNRKNRKYGSFLSNTGKSMKKGKDTTNLGRLSVDGVIKHSGRRWRSFGMRLWASSSVVTCREIRRTEAERLAEGADKLKLSARLEMDAVVSSASSGLDKSTRPTHQ